MAGYYPFTTGRVSFGNGRPQTPLVDIALVRPVAKVAGKPAGPKPQVEQEGFIPPKPAQPQDFEQPSAHPMRRMTNICSDATGISVIDLQSQRRFLPMAKARQILFWIARTFTKLSLVDIGRRIGGRDHTTVLHGVRKVQAVIDCLDIKMDDCPAVMAQRLWAAEWPKASA